MHWAYFDSFWNMSSFSKSLWLDKSLGIHLNIDCFLRTSIYIYMLFKGFTLFCEKFMIKDFPIFLLNNGRSDYFRFSHDSFIKISVKLEIRVQLSWLKHTFFMVFELSKIILLSHSLNTLDININVLLFMLCLIQSLSTFIIFFRFY